MTKLIYIYAYISITVGAIYYGFNKKSSNNNPTKTIIKNKKIKLNDDLDDANLCCICIENPKEYAFNKCGHMCLCNSCSKTMKLYDMMGKIKKSVCPICRIEGHIIKIFL